MVSHMDVLLHCNPQFSISSSCALMSAYQNRVYKFLALDLEKSSLLIIFLLNFFTRESLLLLSKSLVSPISDPLTVMSTLLETFDVSAWLGYFYSLRSCRSLMWLPSQDSLATHFRRRATTKVSSECTMDNSDLLRITYRSHHQPLWRTSLGCWVKEEDVRVLPRSKVVKKVHCTLIVYMNQLTHEF